LGLSHPLRRRDDTVFVVNENQIRVLAHELGGEPVVAKVED
jgi:hypothetical protein